MSLLPCGMWLVGQNGETSHTAQRAIAHHCRPGLAILGHLPPERNGDPEDDDGGEEVHPGDPVMLALGGTVADFAPAMEADGPFQRVMCLASTRSIV